MGTIVQEYGPIYGEVVNGTVSGRPNGSIYVPKSNLIEISADTLTCALSGNNVDTYGRNFRTIAECQDNAGYIQTQVFSDAECTTMVAYRNFAAGQFNLLNYIYAYKIADATFPGVGDDCYFRAQLMSANGDPIATSSVLVMERIS